MNVCIIGNSGNLLDQELGEKIDSCDIVIRIQRFKIEGFEKHVGSKTSIISLGWRGVEKSIKCLDVISDNDNIIPWSAHPLVGVRYQTVMSIFGHSNIVQPSQELYNEVIKRLYSDFWRKIPSSGIMTIEMARNYFSNESLFICGFDEKIEKDHYYDPDFIDLLKPGMTVSGHNWESEWNYIQNLLEKKELNHIRDIY